MKTHQWNTGRHYDKHGQRIVAQADTDANRILFSDLSRNISGYIPLVSWLQTDNYSLERLVMANYDFGNYVATSATLEWKE